MAPAPCNRDPKRRSDPSGSLGQILSMGWELALTVVLACLAGWWLSQQTGSVIPLVALSLVGALAGLFRFVWKAKNL